MKKLIYSAAAMAFAFFAASCQKEVLEPVVSANTVTYTVQVADAVATKALGDDVTAVNELVYEVYRTAAEETTEFTSADNLLYHKTATITNGVATIELEFVNDQNFTVLFWAQTKDNGVYNVENLTNVTITSPDVANNVNAQAFVGRDFVRDCVSDANGKVTLVRPVSQLNIATTPESLRKFDDVIALEGSSVKVSGLATSYNIATLSAFGATATEYTYTETVVPDDVLTVNGKNYTYVAMNYVGFAPEMGTSDVTVSYVINTSEGNIDNEILNVPVKPNYRTNIIGNLITSKTDYTITLEDEWYTPENVYSVWDGHTVTEPAIETNAAGEPVLVIDEASDLAYIAQLVNGTLSTRAAVVPEYDLKLAANIDLANHLWTPIGTEENYFKGTFDGNNYTIKNLNVVVTEAKDSKAFIGFLGYAKDATIKNLNFENVNLNIACLDIDHSQGHIGAVAGSLEGTSTIENVTVKGDIKVEATVTANGASRVAVVAGGNSYGNVTMKNVHVIANDGSYLKANNNVGALAGQLQGKSVFENCSSNIDVTGTKFFAGGIIGLAAGDQTFTNCHTTGDVTITAGRFGKAHDHYRVGGIAGGWADGAKNVCTLTGCSYTGELSGTNADGSVAEAFDYAGYVGRGYTINGCQGSKVVIDGVEYVQAFNTAAEAGIYTVNGYHEIATVADLKRLATIVNAGEPFDGMSVKLVADIDLKNVEWTPIGSATQEHGFMGNFDGNGYTIKNLKMTQLTPDSDGYVYAGLFGVTEGTETQENKIENLVIENVTIETAGHIVAAAVAYPYYTTLENITVEGDINIKGGDYTAGVLAYTRRCVNAKDIAIVGNQGSSIEGGITVGGVISDIQMNGGLTANYSNFSASGLTIKATKNVGGISGIISKQTLNGAVVENVAIVCADARKGIVSGSIGDDSTINNITANNVTGATSYVGATYGTGETCTLTIDGVAYKYLENGKIEDANGYEIVANGLGYKDKTYAVSTAEGLVALATQGLKAGDKVILTADIDLAGVEFNGLDTFHPENNNVFDGQGHKVSNWTYTGGAADMGFIRNWVGIIKNLTIEKASLKTSGRSAIVGAKVYGNIENCHVIDCTLEDSYWACGLIAGLYNAGNISNCSATNSTVKSNGGTGAIVGVVNETAGTRSFTNCVVTGCTVNNTGAYGEAYCGALVCGMINISNSTVKFVGCEYSDNTKVGSYVGDLYYAADDDITVVVE